MIVKIDQVLEQQNKTRYWLSIQTGITYPNIRNLCNGETTSFRFDKIDKICSVLNCQIADILEAEVLDRELFSMSEAINIIIHFFFYGEGFWLDEIEEYPEIKRFIEAGYTYADEQYEDLIKITDEGKTVMKSYIKDISEQYIKFMLTKGKECSLDNIITWFRDKYVLTDKDVAEEISDYINTNLHNYGYRGYEAKSIKTGIMYYRIEKE